MKTQTFFILFLLISCTDLVGQRMWREEVPGRGEVIVADYFEATKFQTVKERLYVVEKYHLGQTNFWDHFRKREFREALGDLDYTLVRFPNHPLALKLLSGIAKVSNKPALPLFYYEKAIKYFPEYALTHAQYGTYLVDVGKVAEGIGRLIEATKIDPKLAVAHADLAKAYFKNNDLKLAEEAARKAKELGYKDEILPTGPESNQKKQSSQ